jgi:hypothetical protein
MKEMFILFYVLIIVHDICKTDASLRVNYFPYVQSCVNITEDGFSIDRRMQYTCNCVTDCMEFVF